MRKKDTVGQDRFVSSIIISMKVYAILLDDFDHWKVAIILHERQQTRRHFVLFWYHYPRRELAVNSTSKSTCPTTSLNVSTFYDDANTALTHCKLFCSFLPEDSLYDKARTLLPVHDISPKFHRLSVDRWKICNNSDRSFVLSKNVSTKYSIANVMHFPSEQTFVFPVSFYPMTRTVLPGVFVWARFPPAPDRCMFIAALARDRAQIKPAAGRIPLVYWRISYLPAKYPAREDLLILFSHYRKQPRNWNLRHGGAEMSYCGHRGWVMLSSWY